MKCGNSVSRCQWQCRKLNLVVMGIATRNEEGVVMQLRLCLLAEQSVVEQPVDD